MSEYIYNGVAVMRVNASDDVLMKEACRREIDRQRVREQQTAKAYADMLDVLMIKCDQLGKDKAALQRSILDSYEAKQSRRNSKGCKAIDRLKIIWALLYIIFVRIGIIIE